MMNEGVYELVLKWFSPGRMYVVVREPIWEPSDITMSFNHHDGDLALKSS